jgi:hypothetical protein
MCRKVCLAAALWAALWGAAISPPEARCQESPSTAGAPSFSIASDCKARLEYARIPAAERPISELGDCVYDFLSFIDSAELITTRGQDGFMKRSASFFDAHMARFAAALEAELWRRFPDEDEFARRRRARAKEKALRRESALVRDYIERSKDRRRYYVDGVSVRFGLDGEYNFDSETYTIETRVTCGQQPAVFYGLCDLKIPDIPLRFTLAVSPSDAEKISRKRGEQRIDISRQFWVVPDLQGVYDPSWLFRGTRYVATARLDVSQAFIEEVELRVKKWYFLSE